MEKTFFWKGKLQIEDDGQKMHLEEIQYEKMATDMSDEEIY